MFAKDEHLAILLFHPALDLNLQFVRAFRLDNERWLNLARERAFFERPGRLPCGQMMRLASDYDII